MPQHPSSQARLIAPIALVVVVIAFFGIVLSSGSGGGGKDEGTSAGSQKKKRGKGRSNPKVGRSTYTVKTGDTLGTISAKTGVDVEKLQELNPQLDPQALVSGQKIKLRE
jgi:LysM repeat protein